MVVMKQSSAEDHDHWGEIFMYVYCNQQSSLFMKPQDLINLYSAHNVHSFLPIWILLLHRRTQIFSILYISELNITGAQGRSMRRPLLEILN